LPRPIDNPPNPWASAHVEYLEDPPPAKLRVYEETVRSIVSRNDSPDVPFTYSVNPYRGCFHGCAYCYARPGHQWLDLGAGTDFERQIVAKVNAAEVLRTTFERPSWRGEALAFSGVTDCYQPLEASYGLTRSLLEVCRDYQNPVGIITKGALVARDVELLAELSQRARCRVYLSIPFSDDAMARAIEPYASSPTRRFEALHRLSAAGICTGVAVAPLIPGLNEDQVPHILERAKQAGAQRAFMILLRLPAEVDTVFCERLTAALPLRANKVLHAIEDVREGKHNNSGFGRRMRGVGPRWEAIERMFEVYCRKLGLDTSGQLERMPTTFRRPGGQIELF
jgi:DNA repair photolyase